MVADAVQGTIVGTLPAACGLSESPPLHETLMSILIFRLTLSAVLEGSVLLLLGSFVPRVTLPGLSSFFPRHSDG